MQINNIQSQPMYSNPNFNARLKLGNAEQYRRFKKMLKLETSRHKKEEFDSLYERFLNNNKGEVVTMSIVYDNVSGAENIKVNRVGSVVECLIPVKKNDEYLYPITNILKETMENPSFKIMWDV